MFRYVLKRLLLFVPTLLIISLIAFGLSKVTPGDPVMRFIEAPDEFGGTAEISNFDREYQRIASTLRLDKPAFYFKFTSTAYPDTLYRIVQRDQRQTLEQLIAEYGNWPLIDSYFKAVQRFERKLHQFPDSLLVRAQRNRIAGALKQLYYNNREGRISFELQQIDTVLGQTVAAQQVLGRAAGEVRQAFQQVQAQASRDRLYIPTFYWYGLDNQYHHWFTNFICGKFGRSYQDSRPVANKMYDALFWTILLNVLSIGIAYIIAIPLGVWAAMKRGQLFDQVSTLTLFMLYSLPSFWVATLLVVFFTTPEYGSWTNIFPSIGLGKCGEHMSWWNCFWERAGHLLLPVICLSYATLAFISRQMRAAMLHVFGQDFIRSARAKGLATKAIVWKHGFRNSLFPLITLFALVFPATISGSVVIEVIFNIPGMGRLAYDAMFARDWPVVFTIMMLTSSLTIIGNVVADVLYAIADPRVAYAKNK